MNNELTLWGQSPVQTTFDLDAKIAETKQFLEQDKEYAHQLSEIGRARLENGIKIGKNLVEMREGKKKTGDFISWAKEEFNITSKMEIYQYIHAWEIYGDEVQRVVLPNLPWRVVNVITEPTMPSMIRQGVESGLIDADPATIREAKRLWFEMEKAQERADKLEQHVMHLEGERYELINENQHLKEQELLYKQVEATKAREAQARELELRRKSEEAEEMAEAARLQKQELEDMNKRIAEMSKPIVITETKEIEVEKRVEVEKIVKDEAEVQRLKAELDKKELQYQKEVEAYEAAQNDLAVLAERNKQLNEESRRNFAETHAIVGRLRIKQEWHMATSEIVGNHQKFDGRVPNEIDRDAFEGEEHARTRQCIEAMEHSISLLKQALPQTSSNMVNASRITEFPIAYIEGSLS